MIKFCYNNNGLRNMDLFDSIKNINKYEYDAVEISFHNNHIHPFHYDPKYIQKVKSLCDDLKLGIAAVAAGADNLISDIPFEPSLIHSDAQQRQIRMNLLKNSIDIAKLLNVPYVIFSSGKLIEGGIPEEAMEILCTEIKKLLDYDDKITLLIEPEPDFFIGTTTKAIELIEKVNNERFWMNLDLGHVNCCEDDYIKKINIALPYARHIHIEDIKDKIHYHQIPGKGDMDFAKIFESIENNHYENYVSVELYNHTENWKEALKESISYLKQYV